MGVFFLSLEFFLRLERLLSYSIPLHQNMNHGGADDSPKNPFHMVNILKGEVDVK